MFDTRTYDHEAFTSANVRYDHAITCFEPRLTPETVALAAGFPVVCSFVNDRVDAAAVTGLAQTGVRLLALRSAGYNKEAGIFFSDLSDQVLQDDVLARLLTFPNVLVTAHQGFLTREALAKIADTTLASVAAFERGEALVYEVRAADVLR
jgi:lactate dehydrogenase-like 2-hydroxyacid dehydrogenase